MAEEENMKLSPFIQKFLGHYLPNIKGVSPLTVKTYRDAFRLFVGFDNRKLTRKRG
jgi:hypothetical protein